MTDDDRRVGPCGKHCAVVDECEARGDVIRALRAENARLREAENREGRIWINSLLQHLPEEKAVLFRDICITADELRRAARAVLGETE